MLLRLALLVALVKWIGEVERHFVNRLVKSKMEDARKMRIAL